MRLQREFSLQVGPDKLDLIRDEAHLLLEKIRSDAEYLFETQIAVLRTEVPVEHINEVFRRINDSGVTLTKYQIWAASWLRDDVHSTHDAILKCIADKRRARANELKEYRIHLHYHCMTISTVWVDTLRTLIAFCFGQVKSPPMRLRMHSLSQPW